MDIQIILDNYLSQANPSEVCQKVITAIQNNLKGKNLNSNDPKINLLHKFLWEIVSIQVDMVELEESVAGTIKDTLPKPPTL